MKNLCRTSSSPLSLLLAVMAMLAVSLPLSASAAVFTLSPTADGDVQIFGGDDVNTTNTFIALAQSGGLVRNGILEYNLSSIPDTHTVISATIDVTLTRFVSNVGSSPAAIDLFAYAGDGTVDLSDFAAAGDQVVDTTTPTGGVAGDVRSFAFTSVTPVSDALVGNLLTLRFETDSFASINFASLENTSWDAAALTIITIPEPSGVALFGIGAAALLFARRRK